MPLSPLRFADVKHKLEAAGFQEHSQVGSHVKFVRKIPGGHVTAIVPRHKEVAVGTQRSIIRQAGLTTEQWESL